MNLEYALQLVKANGNRIQMVDDPTEEIRNAAIMRTPSAIQYIPDATVEEKQLAIEIQGQNDRDGIFDLVEMITGIDDSLLDYALNYNGECIKLIEQPSTNQINRAVTLDGDAIRFIENPTVDIQLIAIGHDLDNLCHIKNPDYDVVTKALADNPCVIEHVDKPHKDHQLYVLKELPEGGLHYINE